MVLIHLQDATVTVVVTMVHWLLLLVTGTKECIPPEVILVIQDVTILEVSYLEVGKSLKGKSA